MITNLMGNSKGGILNGYTGGLSGTMQNPLN